MKKLLNSLLIFSIIACCTVSMEFVEDGTSSHTLPDEEVYQYGDGRDNKDDPGIGYQY